MYKNDKGIAYFRNKQNLRQIDLAENLGIKRYYLSFIENKKIEWDRYKTHVSKYELDSYLSVL